MKGLEYDRVIIAGLNDKAMPLVARLKQTTDTAVKREAETMERSLLYVALTRARRAVLITYHGDRSAWLEPQPE